jgi:3-(3-hydroxy-phenyl)propionate hydroxylase
LRDRVAVQILPAAGEAARRYDARPGTAYLLRPDQHVAARWRQPTMEAISKAYDRSVGRAA